MAGAWQAQAQAARSCGGRFPRTGLCVRSGMPLTGDDRPVYALTFSPDGSTLISGGAGEAVNLWDVSDPAAPRKLGRSLPAGVGSVNSVAVGPGGTWLAVGGGAGKTTAWDLSALMKLRNDAIATACAIIGRGAEPGRVAVTDPGTGLSG